MTSNETVKDGGPAIEFVRIDHAAELRRVSAAIKASDFSFWLEKSAQALEQARFLAIDECAALVDARAQEFNRLRDPGMANHCRSIAAALRSLKDAKTQGGE